MESIEKCSKGHTAKVIFRLKPEMKEFIKEFAGKMNLDISDMMRLMVEYYFFCYFVKQGSYEEIQKKFFDLYPEHDPKTTRKKKKEREYT